MRYETRLLDNGWAVWDTAKNTPAVMNGMWQTGLDIEVAAHLVDILNKMERNPGKEKPAG